MRIPVLGLAVILATPALAESSLPHPVLPSDFHTFNADLVALGRQLFFDPVLSGNDNIACATCHHPALATADAMSLSIGEGGIGLGAARIGDPDNAPKQRIPRNAPALFNLGAREYVTMFHDGRVALDRTAMFGIRMPEGRTLEKPVETVLAAQALLPLLSADEMAGHPGENPVADAVANDRIHGPDGAWARIASEIEAIPAYRRGFDWIIGREEPLHITHVGSALAAFMSHEFRATDSPFDSYLRGDASALDAAQTRGLEVFYGKARCASCHAGKFQTDHAFWSIGLPQFGPGKMEGMESDTSGYADLGRAHVTGEKTDRYRFRTPSLRNVAQTAPYGHNGAYGTLEGIVRHHLDPFDALGKYDRTQARLHPLDTSRADWDALDDLSELLRIATSVDIAPVELTEAEIADLLAFLDALTDPMAALGRAGRPGTVPSGLPLDPVDPPS